MVYKEKVLNLAIKLVNLLNCDKDFIILCLGSKNCAGDSLGCLVGSILKYKYNISNYCYGDLIYNVNNKNLTNILEFIRKKHRKCKIIVVDSAIGYDFEVGDVKLKVNGLIPRSGVDNSYCNIGDIGIVGIVQSVKSDISNLFNIKIVKIFELANFIADIIMECKKILNVLNVKNVGTICN